MLYIPKLSELIRLRQKSAGKSINGVKHSAIGRKTQRLEKDDLQQMYLLRKVHLGLIVHKLEYDKI
ncbi:hypothetical protein MAH4_21180 [Sessilibacter sp. MAH4]